MTGYLTISYDRRAHLLAGVAHNAMLAVACDYERLAAGEAACEIVTPDGSDISAWLRHTVWRHHPVNVVGDLLPYLERHFKSASFDRKMEQARRAHLGDEHEAS